jgi:signal transduction histidine kinase
VKRMLNAKIAEVDAKVVTDFHKAPHIKYPNIYLESILLNLLSNALKYRSPERKPEIYLRTENTPQGILLTISDNGVGLNMQRYGHQIFKLRKTFHKHPESRGIGLFMIKNQLEALGGDISISSIENEGTTFYVNFNSRLDDE